MPDPRDPASPSLRTSPSRPPPASLGDPELDSRSARRFQRLFLGYLAFAFLAGALPGLAFLPLPVVGPWVVRGCVEHLEQSVDHESLRDACRAAIRAVVARDNVRGAFTVTLEWEDRHYPACLRRLSPTHVAVGETWMSIEMGGGFFHYGFCVKLPEDDDPYSDGKRLLPGLWLVHD